MQQVCEMKSLAPALNRMTETDTMLLQMLSHLKYLQNTNNCLCSAGAIYLVKYSQNREASHAYVYT